MFNAVLFVFVGLWLIFVLGMVYLGLRDLWSVFK